MQLHKDSTDERFDERQNLELADEPIIGSLPVNEEEFKILSPICENDFWDCSKLQETIEQLNSDKRIIKVVKEFRRLRRSVFEGKDPDFSTLQTCYRIFFYEIEKLYEIKLGRDYPRFCRARKMFEECLSDEDYERLPENYPIEVPDWLTPSKAETIYQQIKEYKDRQRTRVSLVRTFDSMAHKVVQYSA